MTVAIKVDNDPGQNLTIADLGGWQSVNKKFFDPKAGIMADVERKLGVTTQK